ncbi:MAG: hypothetical protein M0038_06270 [Pseudomonadota bacterium]|jgi:hypothetical protein|nr:hypothetical protein [Pseudomonadota bacterium]
MANENHDLVEMARQQVRLIENGNIPAAARVAEYAAQAIRGVLSSQLPDSERCVYLEFVAGALDAISQGIDARKAFGVWTNSRPQVSPDREAVIILAVGLEMERLRQSGIDSPVTQAISRVARRLKLNLSIVQAAWKKAGGEDAWTAARAE